MFKKKYSTDEILMGINAGDRNILSYIYKKFHPLIQKTIIKKSGSEKDAEDIFQNAIIVIYMKIKNEDLILTVKFKTYLLAVCKKMWYRQFYRKKAIKFENIDEIAQTEEFIDFDEDLQNNIEQIEKNDLYQKHFSKLSIECQILLRMFYDKVPTQKIAEYFDLKNTHQAKKKKFKCKEFLVERIKKDPLFIELFNQNL
jgi:RNA polymerase sigma factor (sigma-70 family)